MFGLPKKKIDGATVRFKISGMHCVSCSMNIDGELEDTDGVMRSETSYANGISTVVYDPSRVSVDRIQRVIGSLHYKAEAVHTQ